jgi:hypothetical protein
MQTTVAYYLCAVTRYFIQNRQQFPLPSAKKQVSLLRVPPVSISHSDTYTVSSRHWKNVASICRNSYA